MYSCKSERHELNGNTAVLENCKGTYEEVLLQVTGAGGFQIAVNGALESGLELQGLAVINMKNFETTETIAESGIYLLPTKGLNHLELSASGQASVVAKFLSDRG